MPALTERRSFGLPQDQGAAWVQGPRELPFVDTGRTQGPTLVNHSRAGEAAAADVALCAFADRWRVARLLRAACPTEPGSR